VDLVLSARPGLGCVVLEVQGDLDLETTPQLREGLQQLVDAGERQVVVDLAEVPFMDSSALGALVLIFTMLRDLGGRLSLATVQRPVASVLRITTVDTVIDVYPTVQAAEAEMPPADGAIGG
jgi:anti-sigma B factor antagonist